MRNIFFKMNRMVLFRSCRQRNEIMSSVKTIKAQSKRGKALRIINKKRTIIPVSDNQHDASPAPYNIVKSNLQSVAQQTLKITTVGD